jgi:hypothetical protein
MGGWHWTWVATGAVSLLGLLLSRLLAHPARGAARVAG